jgi:Domain of unknown function (DUF4129)
MDRRVAPIVIAALLIASLFASVATSGGVGMWTEPQWDPAPPTQEPVEIDTSGFDLDPTDEPEQTDRDPIELPGWIEAVFRVLLVTAGVAIGIALLIAAWRHRPRLRFRKRVVGDDFEALPDVAAAIVDEATAQRATLQTGSPRNAIVQCWLRLERDVASVGLQRHPADTSAEFTQRVLARYSVDSRAIGELAALYREARFSTHPLDESARVAALDALDRLHQTLVASNDDALDAVESPSA